MARQVAQQDGRVGTDAWLLVHLQTQCTLRISQRVGTTMVSKGHGLYTRDGHNDQMKRHVWGQAQTCSLARNLSSDWLSVFWDSLGARTSIDLRVSSRKYALLSPKPVATCGYTCVSTVACSKDKPQISDSFGLDRHPSNLGHKAALQGHNRGM